MFVLARISRSACLSPLSFVLPIRRLFREVLGQGKRVFMLESAAFIVAVKHSFSASVKDETPTREKSSFKKRSRQFVSFVSRRQTRSQSTVNIAYLACIRVFSSPSISKRYLAKRRRFLKIGSPRDTSLVNLLESPRLQVRMLN